MYHIRESLCLPRTHAARVFVTRERGRCAMADTLYDTSRTMCGVMITRDAIVMRCPDADGRCPILMDRCMHGP
eukprot:2382729-Prymnesium_polylepis.1